VDISDNRDGGGDYLPYDSSVLVVHEVVSVGDRVLAFARNAEIRSPMDATSLPQERDPQLYRCENLANRMSFVSTLLMLTIFFYF